MRTRAMVDKYIYVCVVTIRLYVHYYLPGI